MATPSFLNHPTDRSVTAVEWKMLLCAGFFHGQLLSFCSTGWFWAFLSCQLVTSDHERSTCEQPTLSFHLPCFRQHLRWISGSVWARPEFMLLLYNLTLTKKNLRDSAFSFNLCVSHSLLLLTWSNINMLTFQRRITRWQSMVMTLKLTSYLHPYHLVLFSHLVLLFFFLCGLVSVSLLLVETRGHKYNLDSLIITHLSQSLLSFYFWYNI